jgi:glycosyltransferase involved in cell wall biosynthesis
MRMLHLAAGNLYGGVETLLVTLARHRSLCPAMEPHYALCFQGRLGSELAACEVPVHFLAPARVSRPWTVWQARRRLRHVLREIRPDGVVCHSCWPHALFAPVVRAAGLPLLFWAHDLYAGRHWLERWARRYPPDLVLANSRWTQGGVPNLFPTTNSAVLYLPVAAPGGDQRQQRRQVREALRVPETEVVVFQACRLERWKGHSLLLQALGRLADVPGWTCWIAGGAQRPHEQKYLVELQAVALALGVEGRVHFLGQRTDVPRLMAAADVHCQPNLGPEPFGIAFVEALYAGLPVVTTAQGGALEVVNESCGLLVPPGDAAGLAGALRQLIEDEGLRGRLGSAGPARARALCDPATRLTDLHDLALRVVKERVAA